MLYCFTTCAFNYVPNAVLLGQSLAKHLPKARRILMITDDVPAGYDPSWIGFDEVWTLDNLQSDLEHVMPWVFGHTVMELATAVKGFVLKTLLAREDCGAAIFFDPDCELHSAVPQVFTALQTHDIVLIPHTCLPHLNDDWIKFELNQHRVGAFNLGFLAVANTPSGRHFAEWWWDRLKRYCLIDPSRHLFTDQKWIDLVPSYFERVAILREPTMNVARWNTFQRAVSLGADGGVLVDGKPIDFIHYSGFLKIGSYNLGLYDIHSKPWVTEIEVLNALSKDYAARLHPYQSRPECSQKWGLMHYRSGIAISLEHRRAFKENPNLWPRFENPFQGSTAFLKQMKLICANTRLSRNRPANRILKRVLSQRWNNNFFKRFLENRS